MTIIIKSKELEVYCEKFNYANGCLNVEDFVGVEKLNIGKGLHIKNDSEIKINFTNESFYKIKKEAWENIKNNYTPIKTEFEMNKLREFKSFEEVILEVLIEIKQDLTEIKDQMSKERTINFICNTNEITSSKELLEHFIKGFKEKGINI